MKTIITLSLLLFLSVSPAYAELLVIGNIENNVSSLTKKQVKELFLGRSRSFANGVQATPLDVSSLRGEFYEKLTHRSIEQINAYWARLLFSGRSSPPVLKSKQQGVIDAVRNNKGVIAYVESGSIDETQVKILFVVK